jgi:hypothetical protein
MTLMLDAIYGFNCDYKWIFKQCKFVIRVNFYERLMVPTYRKFKISLYSQNYIVWWTLRWQRMILILKYFWKLMMWE